MPEDEYDLEVRAGGKSTTYVYVHKKEGGPPAKGDVLEDYDNAVIKSVDPPTATKPGRIVASR